ncbi:sugar ABC transporter permease [Catellatospora citrea]|uniref:Sugar ABC transporter permease n=2 Tax=Catellatospora citrea TaxID=53366 RepID=A0A8J3P062_9ACTN|nr:carbohydrate ABC transporter membrane protein 1 (CUT1 family) [Catellatospora citrea]GIF97070.1 sugar ABC transporter permease [Catellatospora citrea]
MVTVPTPTGTPTARDSGRTAQRRAAAASPAGEPHRSGGAAAAARRETIAGYGFLGPWLVGFFGLTVGPMAVSLYLAFTRYDIFNPPEWVGFGNFVRMFTDDPVFLRSAQVTLEYVLLGTPVKLAAALAVALLLNSITRGSGFFRSAFYTPSLIGASVSVAIVWRAMFAGDGPVDSSLQVLGVELGGWVGDVDLAIPMMIILVVWQFGAPMVIFLAGLKQVPTELYEAAQVDGAGPVHRFWKVTVPMLSPVIFFNLLLETIHAFQVFGSAFIISNGSGAPGGRLNFITLYMYKRGFADMQMGYAAAIAWVVLVVVAIIAAIMFRTARSWVYYAGDNR